MAVEIYDIDAVKSQLGVVLDEFIVDLRYGAVGVGVGVCARTCVCMCVHMYNC